MKKMALGIILLWCILPICASAYTSHGLYDDAWDFTTVTTDANSSDNIPIPNDIFNRSVGVFVWNSINNKTFDADTHGFIEFTFSNIEVNRSLPEWMSIWMSKPSGGLTRVTSSFFTTTVDGTEVGWYNEKVRFNVIAWLQYCISNDVMYANNTHAITFELGINMNNESISVISYGLVFNITAPFTYGSAGIFAEGGWYDSLTVAEQVGLIVGIVVGGIAIASTIVLTLMHFGLITVPLWLASQGGIAGIWASTETELTTASKKAKNFVGKGLQSMGSELSSIGAKMGGSSAAASISPKTNCTLPKNKSLPECKKKK